MPHISFHFISCDNICTSANAACLISLYLYSLGNIDTEGGLGGAHISSERAKKQLGYVQTDLVEQSYTQNFLSLAEL